MAGCQTLHLRGGRFAAALELHAVRDRMRGRTAAAPADAESGPVTGLLLRSLAVSQFPGIQVRAYSGVIPADQDPERDLRKSDAARV